MLFNQAMDIFTLPTLKKGFYSPGQKTFSHVQRLYPVLYQAQHTYTIDYYRDYNTAKFSKQGLYKQNPIVTVS